MRREWAGAWRRVWGQRRLPGRNAQQGATGESCPVTLSHHACLRGERIRGEGESQTRGKGVCSEAGRPWFYRHGKGGRGRRAVVCVKPVPWLRATAASQAYMSAKHCLHNNRSQVPQQCMVLSSRHATARRKHGLMKYNFCKGRQKAAAMPWQCSL